MMVFLGGGCPLNSGISEPMPSNPPKIWVFPFSPGYSNFSKWPQIPLGEYKKGLIYTIVFVLQGLLFEGIYLHFSQGTLGL